MSLEEEIINYLKENPGANIREIAEALGLSYSIVRNILYRLRNSGIVSKSERGFYILRDRTRYTVSKGANIYTQTDNILTSLEQLKSIVNDLAKRVEYLESKHEDIHGDIAVLTSLRDIVNQLKNTVNKINSKITILEKELNNLKKQVEILSKQTLMQRRGFGKEKETKNPLQSILKSQGIIEIEESRKIVNSRTIHELIESGEAIVIGPYIVSKEYYRTFKRRFPIRLGEDEKLSTKEKKLLKVMLSEGLAYIHGGKEYRIIE